MSARSFGSLFMVASCAGAALGCYLVSLRVASERAPLEDVETRIVSPSATCACSRRKSARAGDCRSSSAGTPARSRCRRPAADQFLQGGFELARLTRPEQQVDFQAPVVLASAPAPQPKTPLGEPERMIPARRPLAPARIASPGKPEDRDARGPGKSGR